MLLGKERGVTYHAEYGWRLLPDVTKTGTYWGLNKPASTNSSGWRDAEHSFERTDGKRRLVAIGDSFTFGTSVDYGDRFTELLETGYPTLEVVNLGMGGTGTDQHLRILELEGVHYQPDVVIHMVFLGNDLDDIRYRKRWGWPKPYYRITDSVLELVRPEITWRERLRGDLYLGELLFRAMDNYVSAHELAPQWASMKQDAVPLFIALVMRMIEVDSTARLFED